MQKLNEIPILNELSYTKGLKTFHKKKVQEDLLEPFQMR